MTLAAWGVVLGLLLAGGLLTLGSWVSAVRRPQLATRVLPYVRDLTAATGPGGPAGAGPQRSPFAGTMLLFVQAAAGLVERVLGGATSVRRRIERANLPITVHDFRVEQVLWGLVAFAGTAALSILLALRSPGRALPLLLLCAVAFTLGVLLRENRLTAQATTRERRILEEFPTVAELLALAVAAGESPVAAVDRVVRRAHGELSVELGRVVAEARTGVPIARALDEMARRTGLPVVARFAEGMAVAVERGTPLADVLHAQAADVREAGRRALIESGARREVAMMVPVVFLVLPITVLFAFWPGVVGLRLVAP